MGRKRAIRQREGNIIVCLKFISKVCLKFIRKDRVHLGMSLTVLCHVDIFL